MYGGDAAGQSVANTLEARSKSWAVAARNAEDGISVAQTAEVSIIRNCSISSKIKRIRYSG